MELMQAIGINIDEHGGQHRHGGLKGEVSMMYKLYIVIL